MNSIDHRVRKFTTLLRSAAHLWIGATIVTALLNPTQFAAATDNPGAESVAPRSFSAERDFLEKYTEIIALMAPDGSGGQVLVAPRFQGRVMISTVDPDANVGIGWINRELIASGRRQPQINYVGGEERLWIGPEGGKYSVFVPHGKSYKPANYQTPALIDIDAFEVTKKDASSIVLSREGSLTNYSGTRFDVRIERSIEVLDRTRMAAHLGVAHLGHLKIIGYQTTNRLINRGGQAWRKETGLLSLWLLGAYSASPTSVVVLPYRRSASSHPVNTSYSGWPPPGHLKVGSTAAFFRGDAAASAKIGLSSAVALDSLGAFDPATGVLTIVQYEKPSGAQDYVNSLWRLQARPYEGDAVNAYNDGPPAPGVAQLGRFFELETSSPAAALTPGASIEHVQRTFHLQGNRAELDEIAKRMLHASLNEIETAFGD